MINWSGLSKVITRTRKPNRPQEKWTPRKWSKTDLLRCPIYRMGPGWPGMAVSPHTGEAYNLNNRIIWDDAHRRGPKTWVVYQIEALCFASPTDKGPSEKGIYIGSTSHPQARWLEHGTDLLRGEHHNFNLQGMYTYWDTVELYMSILDVQVTKSQVRRNEYKMIEDLLHRGEPLLNHKIRPDKGEI